MSGRASNELAETLRAGAEKELEDALQSLTESVMQAAIEYRAREAASKGVPVPAAKAFSPDQKQRLFEEIRLQTRVAAR